MNCLIVDDEIVFRLIIKEMINLNPSLNLVGECSDATDAYKQIMQGKIDLVFLDIKLPGMSGLDLARMLKNKMPLLILLSSDSKHAVEAYDLNVTDYIVKPLVLSRFHEAVERARVKLEATNLPHAVQNEEFIFIRDSYTVKKIFLNDILFIEAKDNYAVIHFSNHNYSIHSPMKTIEQKLPPSIFLRVHRSYIINLSKVDSMEGKTIIINKKFVPVSDAYKAEFNKRILIL